MPAPTVDNLHVVIEAATDKASTLNVKITNAHDTTPLTILTWDAPFDRLSRDTGTYHIKPATPADAEELESLGIKIKRMLPAPREDLVEIPAGESITRQLVLESRWIPTDGQRYRVWANGPWRAVWARRKDDLSDEDLKSILGDFPIGSRYETNVVEMTLTKA